MDDIRDAFAPGPLPRGGERRDRRPWDLLGAPQEKTCFRLVPRSALEPMHAGPDVERIVT
jgi:hypothetical protein